MIQLTKSPAAWGTPEFEDILKAELETLGCEQLPLQQGLTTASYALDDPLSVMIINAAEKADSIHATAGIFYSGIIAGCSCADDPTPVDRTSEYCVITLAINKLTGETTVALLAD